MMTYDAGTLGEPSFEYERIDPAELEPMLVRWRDAAGRLGLGTVATMAGALVLEREFTAPNRSAMLRRLELLTALRRSYSSTQALAGLLELEAFGALVVHPAGNFGDDAIEMSPVVRFHCAGVHDGGAIQPGVGELLPRVADSIRRVTTLVPDAPVLVVVRGHSGSGRDNMVATLLRSLDRVGERKTPLELRRGSCRLQLALSGAVPLWDTRGFELGPDDYTLACEYLAAGNGCAIAVMDAHQDWPSGAPGEVIIIETDAVDVEERVRLWQLALARTDLSQEVAHRLANLLASRNRAGQGTAWRTCGGLRDLRTLDEPEQLARIERALLDLVQPTAVRHLAVDALSRDREEVVAGVAVQEGIDRLIRVARHLGGVRNARDGIRAMFSGASGTGKTMAAMVVARSLSRTLYRVDLATIVSKWVGETERNLREAMHSAEAVGAVLLFDEGDALFGKRGEISRGADRYANLEVSYLLQAVERYSGVLILTTNQQHQLDPAFLRRFDVAIQFEAPDAVQRRAIWEAELGDASAKLDPEAILRISRAAQLCGGNIAAAARMARLLACSRGETQVSLRDLEEAIQSELHKLGSTVSATAWSRGEARKSPSGSSFGEVAGGATNGRERARNAV